MDSPIFLLTSMEKKIVPNLPRLRLNKQSLRSLVAKIIVDGNEIDCLSTGSVSDGRHTFTELYEQRALLFLALCLCNKDKVSFGRDGKSQFPCVYLDLPTGQVSFHLSPRLLNLVKSNFKQVDANLHWDNHGKDEVVQRLKAFLTDNSSSG